MQSVEVLRHKTQTAMLLSCKTLCINGERGGSVVEWRTPEREVGGSKPTAAVLCPWARHFTPRKYWLITQEAVAPSRHDWKIVDWDVKPQHKQTSYVLMICFNKPIRDHQTCKKIKFHIFRFCPTFDMLYLNVYHVQKCKKHLCCNLFWVPTQFDWTIS